MPPQVIIHHPSLDQPRSLLEQQITRAAIEPYLKGSTVFIPGDPGDEKVAQLIGGLKDAGFVFVGETEHVRVRPRTEQQFLLQIDAVVDDAIARVATKMAVNLLAVAVGYEFAMRPEFRPWVCDLSPGIARMFCGGTHLASLDQLRNVTAGMCVRYFGGHGTHSSDVGVNRPAWQRAPFTRRESPLLHDTGSEWNERAVATATFASLRINLRTDCATRQNSGFSHLSSSSSLSTSRRTGVPTGLTVRSSHEKRTRFSSRCFAL